MGKRSAARSPSTGANGQSSFETRKSPTAALSPRREGSPPPGEQSVGSRTPALPERSRTAPEGRHRGWLIRRLLLIADLTGLSVAFLLSELVLPLSTAHDTVSPKSETILFVLSLPLWIVLAKLHRLYDHDEERSDYSTPDDLAGVFHLVTAGTWVLFFGATLSGLAKPQLAKFALFWILAVLLISIARAGARALARRSASYRQNTVIVGVDPVGLQVGRKFLHHPEYGINLVGFIDRSPPGRTQPLEHVPVLGSPEELPKLCRRLDVERVVITFPEDGHDEMVDLVRSLSDLEMQVDVVPRLFDVVGPGVTVHTVEGLPLMGLPPVRLSRSSAFLKRTMDLLLAALGLFLIAPLFAAIAITIKVTSPGPFVFSQVRMGARDQTFRMLKFRTMDADADARKHTVSHLNMHLAAGGDPRMFKVPNDPRVTSFGRFLRRYSLDELPQLINVLKGEMSLVGPRPLILEEDKCVVEWARKRVTLKPGMTGLWQVLGRGEIQFEEMTKLDYIYVTNWSLWRDIRLLLQTVPAVLRSRAAY
jgi:exopolysaccharide biosynthesis polyprenyl glycosylphosphotransferase